MSSISSWKISQIALAGPVAEEKPCPTILLVDDDRDLAATLQRALEVRGYRVVTAHSAAEGLRRLEQERPDLLILDVMMETDTAGFEMVYQIRSWRPESRYAAFRETPVILLTAVNQATRSRFSLDEENSFLPEIDAFLTKPFQLDALLEKVDEILSRKQSKDSEG
ncbi:MAG: hypothetical protein Kow00109_06250 [Acidobacteriota bacterium]